MRFGKSYWKNYNRALEKEWILANGISGFSGCSIVGANGRKYNGLLVGTLNSPEERYMILSKVEEYLNINRQKHPLSTTKYKNSILEGYNNQQSFQYDGMPHYRYCIEDVIIDKSLAMKYEENIVTIKYDIKNGSMNSELNIDPFMCFRDLSMLNKDENIKFKKDDIKNGFKLTPMLRENISINIWMENGTDTKKQEKITEEVYYDIDKATGDVHPYERFYIPGTFRIKLKPREEKTVYIICSLNYFNAISGEQIFKEEIDRMNKLKNTFKDNRLLSKYLPIAADQFIVKRDSTSYKTILAGYPWFLDWGRDAMIAINGLTLSTNRLEDAKEILKSFSIYEKEGLIPNMFPGSGSEPIYNTVDASLWFINAAYSLLLYGNDKDTLEFIEKDIYPTIKNIIKFYKEGTKFSIGMEEDGLISAGSGLDQVTWMDVRVNGIVVTPRHGKPVEINALWYNALNIAALLCSKFEGKDKNEYFTLAKKVKESFNKVFWNENAQCLYDVINSKESDNSIRCNQIWAVSLWFTMLDREKEIKIVDKVFKELYTPYGLRSLNRDNKEYKPFYCGELLKRDMSYHQGTVWAFPLGAFFTAYCKVNDYSKESVEFVDSLMRDMENHIKDHCLGTIAEIFDGDSPNTPRGCYSQGWSVGEMIRVYYEDILGNIKTLNKAQKDIFERSI